MRRRLQVACTVVAVGAAIVAHGRAEGLWWFVTLPLVPATVFLLIHVLDQEPCVTTTPVAGRGPVSATTEPTSHPRPDPILADARSRFRARHTPEVRGRGTAPRVLP